jgi:hypothetical protein
MAPFSFPALEAGPPSRRNWYQELLDHPDCHGAQQVSEAYEAHRTAYLSKNLQDLVSAKNSVTANKALNAYLDRQQHPDQPVGPLGEPLSDMDINCLGISTRPPPAIISLIQSLQTQLSTLIGPDFYAMPESLLHIAMVELAHRHTIAYLSSISAAVGPTRLQTMLNLVSTLPSKPRLVSPRLSFDAGGIALTFIPDPAQTYTYHHLRADMHAIALESGGAFDMCYTAPSAHVTLGRFGGDEWFFHRANRRELAAAVERINQGLGNGDVSWVLGEGVGLELQAGYLKFGVEREKAEMFGKEG